MLIKTPSQDTSTIVIPRSWWSVLPRFGVFVIYAIGAIWFWILFPKSIIFTNNFLLFPFYILSFMVTLFGLRPALVMFNTYQAITARGLHTIEGIYSLNRKEQLIAFRDIVGASINCSIYDRLCRMGNIEIGTAMIGETEVLLKGIKNPEYYLELLEQAIDRSNF